MAGTVIVAVRRAVAEGLANEPGLQGVDVNYGYRAFPGSQIFTDRGRATTDPSGLKSGRNFRDEEAEFDIVVHVEEDGASLEEADDKATTYGRVVEEFLADRKNNELGVPGLQWIRQSGWQMRGGQADHGALSQVIYTVRYRARIT